jgi:acyl-CoA synthetase (AMP-forming)/AMP-acid ligase II
MSKLRVLAAVLRSRVRLAHGDVVFVLAPAGVHVSVLYYALMSVGAVMSPANPSLTAAEVFRLLALSDPAAVAGTRGKLSASWFICPRGITEITCSYGAWCFLARLKE